MKIAHLTLRRLEAKPRPHGRECQAWGLVEPRLRPL